MMNTSLPQLRAEPSRNKSENNRTILLTKPCFALTKSRIVRFFPTRGLAHLSLVRVSELRHSDKSLLCKAYDPLVLDSSFAVGVIAV